MSPRDRFQALLSGTRVDRVPRVLWKHFPDADYDLDAFVRATLDFQRRHDLDLLKISPRSSYPIRDYGVVDEFTGDFLGRTQYVERVVHAAPDWRQLRPLDPGAGWLGHTGDCIRRICAGADASTPVVATIFSPATQAKNLAGLAALVEHWREDPASVRAGLETLAESTVRFIRSLEGAALDGLFYIIQECGLPALSPTYGEMCAALDHAILSAVPFPLNFLHLHGPIVAFDDFADYPVSVIHWDESASGLPIADGRKRFKGLVSGGVHWPDGGWSAPRDVQVAAREAVQSIGTERLVLGAGCVIPHATRSEHIDAFCAFDV